MIRKEVKSVWAVVVGAALAVGSFEVLSEYEGSSAVLAAETGTPTQTAQVSQSELRALVAPIALYPDKLVAIVLAAATFPDQVAIADYWLQQNKSLTGSALMQAVNTQSWDASVKALTQFPSVLGNMAKSLSWTSQLGEAYHNQKTEVMTAVQTLRAQAKAAGNLKSTPQHDRRATDTADDCDSTGEPAGRLRPGVQPRCDLRLPVCDTRIYRGRSGSGECALVRCWNRSRRADGRVLRMGMACVGMRLAWRRGSLQP